MSTKSGIGMPSVICVRMNNTDRNRRNDPMKKQHPKAAKFADRVKRHMSKYRQEQLDINETGTWRNNGKAYGHILPGGKRKANILEAIRNGFWDDYPDYAIQGVELHPGFHHLTSSQAMCLNLFYPFVLDNGKEAGTLQEALGLPVRPAHLWFEKVLRPEEGTSFDFYMEYQDGAKVFFELKYTETEFGSARMDAAHMRKYEKIYRPLLDRLLVPDKRDDPKFFFRHYQIFRNLLYLLEHEGNHVFFIIPRKNANLRYVLRVIREPVMPEFEGRIHFITLESVVERLAEEAVSRWPRNGMDIPTTILALGEFVEKYLPDAGYLSRALRAGNPE